MVTFVPMEEVIRVDVEDYSWTQLLLTNEYTGALPSKKDGWRFNFIEYPVDMNPHVYVVLPRVRSIDIMAVMIYSTHFHPVIQKNVGTLDFIEVHKASRFYKGLAGCLIATAVKCSIECVEGEFKGALFFEVVEQTDEGVAKLMNHYIKTYGAEEIHRVGNNRIFLGIRARQGQVLIDKYLDHG